MYGLSIYILYRKVKVLTERMGGNISAYYQNERLYVTLDFSRLDRAFLSIGNW